MLRKVVAATTLGLLPIVAALPSAPAYATQSTQVNVEVGVSPTTVAVNGEVTVVGRVTDANDDPIPDADAKFRWYSNSRVNEGEGQLIFCKTNDDGVFTTTQVLNDPGANRFVAEYLGGEGDPPQAETIAWAIPAQVPEKAGDLVSDNGVVFAPGVRETNVSGGGYQADAPVGIVAYPNGANGRLLATTTADKDGNFEVKVDLPEDYNGGYTLASLGSVEQSGQLANRTLTLPITVLTPPATPVATSTDALGSSAGTAFTATSLTTKIAGAHFEQSTSVSILVYSTPVVLKTVKVAADGTFEVTVTLPSGLSGDHTLVAMGQASGDTVTRVLTLPITVAAAPVATATTSATTSTTTTTTSTTLPVTGPSTPAMTAAGVLMLLAGAALYLAARRRRVTFTTPA